MRLFFAFELPEPIRDELAGLTAELAQVAPRGVKWVEPENLHITLQFLGEINDADVPGLDAAFAEDVREYNAFEVRKPRAEIVPARSPRILWTGFDTEYRHIFTLPARILHHLEQQGYRDLDRKPLRLHATLGRINGELPRAAVERLLGYRFQNVSGTIDEISLYKSTLLPKGPVYTRLYDYSLT